MAGENIASVKVYQQLVQGLLDKATEIKRDCSIEPPLTDADLGDAIRRIQQDQESGLKEQSQQAQYAVVETAFREKFYDLLVSNAPSKPAACIISQLTKLRGRPQHRLMNLRLFKCGTF